MLVAPPVVVPVLLPLMPLPVAVPQQDSHSSVTNFAVHADAPVRYETDSQGNRVGYLELRAPFKESGSLEGGAASVIREEFDLTRTEIRTRPDPAATRALTDSERSALGRHLTPTTHVVVNDKISALSASIVGGEQNPVLAARKIYDWTLANVEAPMGDAACAVATHLAEL